MELNSLCRTVNDAWKKLDSTKLTNVYNRWLMVLDLVLEDDGGNQLIEAKQGKFFRAPRSEVEEEETERVSADGENITAEKVDKIDLELA